MRGPVCGTEVEDHGLGNGWKAVELAPLGDASLKKVKEFPLLGKSLILKRTSSKDSNTSWKKIREQGSGQDPVI